MIGSAQKTAARPQKQSAKVARYPAPLQGVDNRKAIGSEDLGTCVYTFNLMPYEFGMRVRNGFREHHIDLPGGVHTLIPFDSVGEEGAGDKLFAITNEGIFDASLEGDTPVQMIVFADQTLTAGYGTFTHFVDQAEVDVLFYADNLNGLYSYDALTETWTNEGILDNLDETTIKYVVSHKNNVWFAVRGSTIGYFLPVLARQGEVTPQHFGDKFKHGGTLEGLFSWTVDGGDGIDDILVAVSHAGDVILYTGDGPEASNFGMKGIFYIGEVPNTPRFGSEQGGELRLLSASGLTSMNDLLQGVDTSSFKGGMGGIGIASAVTGIIREKMRTSIQLEGWSVALLPAEGGILISTPTIGSEAPIQYYYNISTPGWGFWRGVPMACFTEYQNKTYFGTEDGRVFAMDVNVDYQLITPVDPAFNGNSIEFSILTNFTSLEEAAIYKRVSLVRPDFLGGAQPEHETQIRYDYDLIESGPFNGGGAPVLTVGSWTVANWDQNLWASKFERSYPSLKGTWGYGRYVAIATRGETRAPTRLIGWDMVYVEGGPLL